MVSTHILVDLPFLFPPFRMLLTQQYGRLSHPDPTNLWLHGSCQGGLEAVNFPLEIVLLQQVPAGHPSLALRFQVGGVLLLGIRSSPGCYSLFLHLFCEGKQVNMIWNYRVAVACIHCSFEGGTTNHGFCQMLWGIPNACQHDTLPHLAL